MKYYNIILGSLFFFISVVGCQAQTKDSSATHAEKIGILMQSLHKKGRFNGVILVSEAGKIIYKDAIGIANKAKNEELSIESSFYLASVSKQFTAMAIMILNEKKSLSYDDKLSKYFQELPSYANQITIKHLLTHTSGIPDYFGLGLYKAGLKNSDVLESISKQEKLEFTPGEKHAYSNSGYVLLAMIVEKVSGHEFHQFMKTFIFEPIRMNNTLVFNESKPTITNRVIGYNKSGKLDDYEILTAGDGGIYSTVEDLYRWEQSLYTEKLVSQTTMSKAFEPVILANGEISNYGFGWALNPENNTAAHGGGLSGFRTFLKRDLKNNNSYIILTNRGNAVAMKKIITEIDEILSDKY